MLAEKLIDSDAYKGISKVLKTYFSEEMHYASLWFAI